LLDVCFAGSSTTRVSRCRTLTVQPTEDFRRQEVNLVGPFIVTKAFAPLLGAREGRGAARTQ
jgi:NAD(P)-dependent dehydrogenase (short-subunit alcohol dehydrogenase family)